MHVIATYIYLLIIFTKIWNFLSITYVLHIPTVLVLCFNINKFKIAMKILCDMLVNFIQYMYPECSIELPYRWKLWRGNHLSLSLICSKFHCLFLPALPKKLPIILTLFSYHYQVFPYFSFALMFQVTM